MPPTPLHDSPEALQHLLTAYFNTVFSGLASSEPHAPVLSFGTHIQFCDDFPQRFAYTNVPSGDSNSVLFRLLDSVVNVQGPENVAADLSTLTCRTHSDFLTCCLNLKD